jgi:hypothetical protein
MLSIAMVIQGGKQQNLFGVDDHMLLKQRVDPVGPLSKSGGIVELARINAPDISAFIDVAWVPTLLPRLVDRFLFLLT